MGPVLSDWEHRFRLPLILYSSLEDVPLSFTEKKVINEGKKYIWWVHQGGRYSGLGEAFLLKVSITTARLGKRFF